MPQINIKTKSDIKLVIKSPTRDIQLSPDKSQQIIWEKLTEEVVLILSQVMVELRSATGAIGSSERVQVISDGTNLDPTSHQEILVKVVLPRQPELFAVSLIKVRDRLLDGIRQWFDASGIHRPNLRVDMSWS